MTTDETIVGVITINTIPFPTNINVLTKKLMTTINNNLNYF